jgi:glycosyltransferase involved in cell wall biosynthesis
VAGATRAVRRPSVSLPALPSAHFLRAAVQSILDQTFRDFELLAIDDGSADESRDILKTMAQDDPRLFVHAEPHRGLAGTLNRGIELARGAYIARMDADDIAVPERFERQVAYLDRNPRCVVVGTGIQKIDASNEPGHVKILRTLPFDPIAFPPSLPQRGDVVIGPA